STADQCPSCGSTKIVKGVFDRINELADISGERVVRPPYLYQVPLEYLPMLRPKTLRKLLDCFQTEMNVIHHASFAELQEVIPKKVAESIIKIRVGELPLNDGGSWKYIRIAMK